MKSVSVRMLKLLDVSSWMRVVLVYRCALVSSSVYPPWWLAWRYRVAMFSQRVLVGRYRTAVLS